jgi:hypothetical protein
VVAIAMKGVVETKSNSTSAVDMATMSFDFECDLLCISIIYQKLITSHKTIY